MKENCYLILYQPAVGQNVTLFETAVKSYGTWAKITQNNWAIVTSKSATEVRDHLKALTKTTERLMVIKSATEAAWANVICTNEWLQKNL